MIQKPDELAEGEAVLGQLQAEGPALETGENAQMESDEPSTEDNVLKETESSNRPVAASVAVSAPKPKARKEEIAPDILKAIREVCELTVDKKKFSTSKASAVLLGFSHPLLRAIAPDGRERKLYTSKPFEVDGREVFVYKQWRPMNIIKLRSLQTSLKKVAAQAADGAKGV